MNEFEKFDGLSVLGESEGLCEDVGRLVDCGYVLKVNLICHINFTDVVEASVNMLCLSMFDIVFDVVALSNIKIQFFELITENQILEFGKTKKIT